MQIKVECSCGQGNCRDWAILELQGVVEAQPSFQGHLHNLHIGLLCRPSSQETYTLTVGYHELTGTKVPVKKPILVLKKTKVSDEDLVGGGGGEGEKDSWGDIAPPSNSRVQLAVIGIIRHKILFKTRPKALISGPETVAKGKISAPNC